MDNSAVRALREDRIVIYFQPRGTRAFSGHSTPGDWIVADPKKVAYPGQTLTWKAVGGCNQIELNLPDVFCPPLQKVEQGDTVSATLKTDASPGPFAYEVYCNDQLAIGGSSPIIIIDP